MASNTKISGTGNSVTRINEITADDLATFRNYIIGWDSGVVNGFDIVEQTDTSVTLSKGLMFAYSYLGYEEEKTFYFNKTSATQYHFIYGEIDKSVVPNTFELKVKNNQGGSEVKPTTFRQDILSTVKTGVFQLPLYRITLSSNGIERIEDIRDKKNAIKKARYTNRITEKIEATVEAYTQNISDWSKKIATTMFVHNAVRYYIDNNVRPTAIVNIRVVNGTADKNILTFGMDNYNRPQQVNITGIRTTNVEITYADDNLIVGDLGGQFNIRLLSFEGRTHTIRFICR